MLFSWVLFRAETLTAAGGYFAAMFGLRDAATAGLLLAAELYTPLPLLVAALCVTLITQPVRSFDWARAPLTLVRALGLLALFVVSLAVMSTQAFNPFLYFQF